MQREAPVEHGLAVGVVNQEQGKRGVPLTECHDGSESSSGLQRRVSWEIVGASMIAVRGSLTSNCLSILANRFTARREFPPSSKKLSWKPTTLCPSTCSQISSQPGFRRGVLERRDALGHFQFGADSHGVSFPLNPWTRNYPDRDGGERSTSIGNHPERTLCLESMPNVLEVQWVYFFQHQADKAMRIMLLIIPIGIHSLLGRSGARDRSVVASPESRAIRIGRCSSLKTPITSTIVRKG